MATESELLTSLGITDPTVQNDIMTGAARLLVLDCSAHLDWDWLLPFPLLSIGGTGGEVADYFNSPTKQPANTIFTSAAVQIASTDYHYSICEMGFLRAFANGEPSSFATLSSNAESNANLRIAGGGITSPDNLLSHGEAFIRCYLAGHQWLAQSLTAPPPPVSVWLPDDFGHQPNLPVIVQAMGLSAAGFARIPGNGTSLTTTISGGPSMVTNMTPGPIDFTWTAPDGSSIFAHWLIGFYTQGSGLSSVSDIYTYLALNAAPSPTPYIYVPVINDFRMPNTAVTGVITGNSPVTYEGTDVYLAAGAFEDYAQLAMFHPLTSQPFDPNPYYTGCYATRPELKVLHQRATRNLLAAELFSIISAFAEPTGSTASLGTGMSQAQLLAEAWNLLLPSTHHDYITGTAVPNVYHREQLTLLRQADARAQWLLSDALQSIAANINPSQFETGVAVFNSLGFARTEVVEISKQQLENWQIQKSGDGYQASASGGLLFMATAPSMGYQTTYLTSQSAPPNAVSVTTGTPTILENGLVKATLTTDSNGVWGLTSVIDLATNTELIQSTAVANDLIFYYDGDGADEYKFQTEVMRSWTAATVTLTSNTIEVVESGPLRARVVTSATYSDAHVTIEFVREYILHANEPMLRMRSSGAAPLLPQGSYQTGCSIVVAFPLAAGANGIGSIQYGTPYHWTDWNDITSDDLYWNDQTFLATHHFVLPIADGGSSPLCAIYHADVHAWGLSYQWDSSSQEFDTNNGVLYGCLWRNDTGSYFSESLVPYGADPEVHVREYALRMPSSLGDVSSGAPLQEAMAFASPMRGLVLELMTTDLDDQLSLVSSSEGSLVTVAKQGTVNLDQTVFRVYTAGTTASSPTSVTLTVASQLDPSGAAAVTALEQPLADGPSVQTTADTITFSAPTALTTIAF